MFEVEAVPVGCVFAVCCLRVWLVYAAEILCDNRFASVRLLFQPRSAAVSATFGCCFSHERMPLKRQPCVVKFPSTWKKISKYLEKYF
jgi:hypothetical protein